MEQFECISTKLKYKINQVVSYRNRNKSISRGRITHAETHYNFQGISCHIYCIHTAGNVRSAWVGEDKILEGN